MKFTLLVTLACIAACNAIDWSGDWAMNCDFPGKDLRGEQVSGEQCSSTCQRTNGCTHYTWTNYNGGTCWMKTGGVSKSDAIYKAGAVCGVINGSGNNCNGPKNGELGGGCETGDGSQLNKGQIVWSDEFDYYGPPSASKWREANDGSGGGNNEAQYYRDGGRNAKVSGGNLVIEARKENYGGKSYTSGKLTSKQSFKYGIFEMNAKLPRGKGTWAAFWLLHAQPFRWPRDGEIDIMENVGYNENYVVSTIHTEKYNHMQGNQKSSSHRIDDPHNSFHTYTVDWTPTYIKGYVDGHNYFTYLNTEKSYSAWPFDAGFNIIVNNAVGGNWGGQQGIDSSAFPNHYVIDYVRVYNNGHTRVF